MIGCNNIAKLQIPAEIIVFVPDNGVRSEVLLGDFIENNKFYMFLYINLDCSICLFELEWWLKFSSDYKLFTIIFIVHTENPLLMTTFSQIKLYDYPFILDNQFKLYKDNKLSDNELIITDDSLNCLYRGDPAKDSTFIELYNARKNVTFLFSPPE